MKKNVIDQYIKDTKMLEYKVKYSKLFNAYYKILEIFTKFGINSVPNLISIFVASTIASSIMGSLNHSPFKLDEKEVFANSKTTYYGIETSVDTTSFDKSFNDSLKYTTAWKEIGNGFYERTITHYKFPVEEEINNKEEILSLSKDALDEMYETKTIETVSKNYLTDEDNRFNEETVILEIDNGKSQKYVKLSKQSIVEEIFFDDLVHFLVSFIAGSLMGSFIECKILGKKRVIKSRKYLDKKDLEEMAKVIEFRKQNMELLKDNKKLKKVLK